MAALDGAGPVRKFFYITVPMISGAIFFNVIVLTIAALQVFDQAYLLFWRDQTSTSPEASLFYGIYLFQQAFREFNFGFASAMAWVLFVLTSHQPPSGENREQVRLLRGRETLMATTRTQPAGKRLQGAGPSSTAQSANSQRRKVRTPRGKAARLLLWTALTAISCAFLYPLAWLIAASLKPRAEVFDNALVPRTFSPQNYVQVWSQLPLVHWVANSFMIAVLAASLVTVSSAMVAFGFAYFRFPGRNFLFGLVLATMMLPGAVTMVPQYLIWKNLGSSHLDPALRDEFVRFGFLHLPATAVLPRASA